VKATDIALRRLRLQRIAGPRAGKFPTPADAVRWFGAVQSQDYLGAKWAIGLRLKAGCDADVDAAFDRGDILRTHVLRPTWHFVTAADLRWMVALTAPRIRAQGKYRDRQLGLDEKMYARTAAAIAKILEGGKHLTRLEIGAALARMKLPDGIEQRLHILMRAELDGVVCSGPLRGKQHTYARIDERLPPPEQGEKSREEALAELTRRFFASRGPATAKDFAWWAGLTGAQAREGIELVKPELARAAIEGKTYFFEEGPAPRVDRSPSVHLLPNYDEYLVPYVDRDVAMDERHLAKLDARGGSIFRNVVLKDGRVVGTWTRTLGRTPRVVPSLFVPFRTAEKAALAAAIQRYTDFLRASSG
jgi:hypothetical protein